MIRCAFSAVLILVIIGNADAQPIVAPELLDRTLRSSENTLSFCIGEEAYLRDFEIELANAVASVLLLEAEIVEYPPLNSLRPYDYTIGHEFDDIYLLLNNECDVFMGMTLADDPVGDWLEFSEPVYETSFVLVALQGTALSSLGEADRQIAIGTRLGSAGDLRLSTFLRSLPESRRPRRFPFNDNVVLMRNLQEGTVDLALVWEPALRGIAEHFGDALALQRINSHPFSAPTLEFGFVYLRGNTFVRDLVDEAIVSLRNRGTIDELVEDFLH